MIHLRKSVAWLCIGLVVFVAVTATAAGEIAALLAPLWLLCLYLAGRVRRDAARPDERLLALLALVPARAPPARFALVKSPSS